MTLEEFFRLFQEFKNRVTVVRGRHVEHLVITLEDGCKGCITAFLGLPKTQNIHELATLIMKNVPKEADCTFWSQEHLLSILHGKTEPQWRYLDEV